MKHIYCDRSRAEAYQRCRRLRYLEYHAGSAKRGLSPIRKSIHLVLGGAVHSGLEVMLRQAQEWLHAFRRIHDTDADDAAIIEALFSGVYDTGSKPMPNIRAIEDDAVLAALDDLRAAMRHGVELDQQEQLAGQQPQQSIAAYSSTTGGTFQGKPNAEAAIEITFDGWDIGSGGFKTELPSETVKVEDVFQAFGDHFFATRGKPSAGAIDDLHNAMDSLAFDTQAKQLCKCGHAESEHIITRTEMGYGDITNQCSKCSCYGYTIPNYPQTLDAQLSASLGQDWANVQETKPTMMHISEVTDWPTGAAAEALLALPDIEINQQTAKAMADQAAGVDDYLREELAAQVEAMVRAYARRRLRPLLEQFEVLEVEREGEWKLGEAEPEFSAHVWPESVQSNESLRCARCHEYLDEQTPLPCIPATDIIFMSRLDALLLERQTGYLYLQSYKTTGAWDRRREADAQVDMQGLSEAVDVEKRLGSAWNLLEAVEGSYTERFSALTPQQRGILLSLVDDRVGQWLVGLPEAPRVLGVRYEYLLKGPRRQDKKDLTSAGFARYVADTPLIRAYKQDGITADDRRWATSYDWFELTGKSRRLDYRSWQKAPVWKFMSIAAWIDVLDKGEIQPDCYDEQGNPVDVLAEQFVPPIHVYRNEDDMRDMLEQLEAQETQVAVDVAAVQAVEHDYAAMRSELNKRFQQNRHSCSYPGLCQMRHVCFGPQEIRERPESSGLYQIRVPNHPIENCI